MKAASIIRRMCDAGLTMEQALIAIEAFEAEQAAEKEAKLERARANNAARQRAFRERNANNAVTHITPITPVTRDSVTEPSAYKETTRAHALIPVGEPIGSPQLVTPRAKALSPQPDEPAPKPPAARAVCELFERFYRVYPKRQNRKAAEARFATAVRNGVDPEAIIAAAERFAAATRQAQTELRFVKAPDVWLNKGCWEDEHLPERERPPPGKGGGWAKLWMAQHERRASEQSDERTDHYGNVSLLPVGDGDGRGADGADAGGVSREAVELLVGNSFRRM